MLFENPKYDPHRLQIEITPELEAELIEVAKHIEISPAMQKRIDAFSTPIHWTTWHQIVS